MGGIAVGGVGLENAGVLVFVMPVLVGVAPVVMGVGVWGILRASRRTVAVSSTRLWAGLGVGAERRKRGRVDGVLVMLLLAAVMGALALAGPGWRRGVVEGPRARVVAVVRSTGEETQLFLKVAEATGLAGTGEVGISDGGATVWQSVAVEELAAGRIFVLGKAGVYTVTVRANDKVVDVFNFSRPTMTPFGLLMETSVGRGIDPALVRAFAIFPGARRDDPTVTPSVVLVDSLDFAVGKVEAETLVVASARTPLPGIVATGVITFAGEGVAPVGDNLPGYMDLRGVRVRAMMGATLSAEWTVVASVAGHPWVAERRFLAKGPTVCWMASLPSSQSTWGVDPSFVLYCAELVGKTFPATGGREWVGREERGEMRGELPVVELSGFLGVAAVGLIVGAMGMRLWRVMR